MDLKIAVLTIGDELINGEMADTNTAAIASVLGARGLRIKESLSVGDEQEDIVEALRSLAGRRDFVIVTGGLGPTEDDLTARAAARAFDRRLALDERALAQIREYFRLRGRPMPPRNEKQALLPQRCDVLPNSAGTAPGFRLLHGKCEFLFLPGVPAEMSVMLEDSVLPRLEARGGGGFPLLERVLKVFGLSEPKVEELLTQKPLPEGAALAFGVEFPMVHVKLRASDPCLLEEAERACRKILGDSVVASGRSTLAQETAAALQASRLTLSLAESCTGGLIAKMLTDLSGASSFLERGAVTYANSAKSDWLQVPDEILEKEGAVSEACALAMARGIRSAAGTDLALSVTGIAGPDGGTAEKPVGTVYIALAAEGGVKVKGYRFGGDREKVRLLSAHTALELIRRAAAGRLPR